MYLRLRSIYLRLHNFYLRFHNFISNCSRFISSCRTFISSCQKRSTDSKKSGLPLPNYSTLLKNALVRSCRGFSNISSGSFSSTTNPPSMKMTRSPTSRAKPISWVTTTIVIPSRASCLITSNTSPTISGSRLRWVHRTA